MRRSTIALVLRKAVLSLSKAEIAEPEKESCALLAHVLKKDKTYLYAHSEIFLKKNQEKVFKKILKFRSAHVPLAYLFKEAEFYGLTFFVNSSVLIPRPETERLAEIIIETCSSLQEEPKILDLGTGSGCLALSLAKTIPAKIWATDISPKALSVAKTNARRLGLQNRIVFKKGDLFAPFPKNKFSGFFDLLVSNPPYIPVGKIKNLMPEVLREPMQALAGGRDGLKIIKSMVLAAPTYLKPAGWLALEIGYGQKDQVSQYLLQAGFYSVKCFKDFGGIDRVLVAKNGSPSPVG
jgi:release factor glutamine methyltransferase